MKLSLTFQKWIAYISVFIYIMDSIVGGLIFEQTTIATLVHKRISYVWNK